MLSVEWESRQLLEGVNLTELSKYRLSGVYIIWYEGIEERVVRIGQGIILDRLSVHRNTHEIMSYKQFGELFVTWTIVEPKLQNGIENYLGYTLKPLVAERFPDVVPIPVNLPLYLKHLSQ
ncbi:MAG: hypothetical protein ACKO99_14630 [Dolichospermum sp.]